MKRATECIKIDEGNTEERYQLKHYTTPTRNDSFDDAVHMYLVQPH